MDAQIVTYPDFIKKVSIYPNPFASRISLEITIMHNANSIVCMTNENDKIVKMFSWYLKAGTNKTSLDGLGSLQPGNYAVTVRSTDGEVICDTTITKQ